jgi:uncharacterized protein
VIINTHVHMSRLGRDMSPALVDFYLGTYQGSDCWQTGQPWRPEDLSPVPEQLIAHMDQAGIDKAFVLGIVFQPLGAYDHDAAAYVSGMVAQYPDRLIGFYTADPLGGNKELDRFVGAVQDRGLRGLKLLPSGNHVAPSDRRIWPFYEAAESLGVPIVMHTGWNGFPKDRLLDWEHPLHAEDIVQDFPRLKLVLAHLGFQWAEETIMLMARSPNLYGDVAFWHEIIPLWRAAQIFTWAKKLGVLDHFLWGSDYPFAPFSAGKAFFERLPEYTRRHELEPFIDEEDMESFFGGAAARLIGLAPERPRARLACD